MSGAPPPTAAPGSWKLAPDVAGEAQGLVVSGFADLPAARALLLRAKPETRGGGWIAALDAVAPITAADGKQAPSVALAFTSTGLAQLGLDMLADAYGAPSGAADHGRVGLVESFALPFVEGMMQDDRRRRLGDAADDGSVPPVIEWSGGSPHGAPTPVSVHAMLLIYEERHEALVAHVQAIQTALTAAGVDIVRSIALDLRTNGNDTREHFGFVDGISQPIPFGEGTSDGAGNAYPQDPLHGVPLGEILLGHRDAHGQTSRGPFLAGTRESGTFQPSTEPADTAAVAAMLDPRSQLLHDLGRNGSYLVVRELRQDVAGFEASLDRQARELNARYPGKPPLTGRDLAERVVGRTHDGDMLTPGGTLPPVGKDPDNAFLYYQRDQLGRGCPMGSHIRRANPRDGLAYKDEVCADLLRSANAHRLLRRGRKFGGDVAGSETRGDEGLLFIALNGDIARQFEFVQQNWMLNPNFSTLFDEVDPLVGPKSAMTLPDAPLRRRIEVETYVTLVGGDYFFLPSLPTLRILAALTPGPAQ